MAGKKPSTDTAASKSRRAKTGKKPNAQASVSKRKRGRKARTPIGTAASLEVPDETVARLDDWLRERAQSEPTEASQWFAALPNSERLEHVRAYAEQVLGGAWRSSRAELRTTTRKLAESEARLFRSNLELAQSHSEIIQAFIESTLDVAKGALAATPPRGEEAMKELAQIEAAHDFDHELQVAIKDACQEATRILAPVLQRYENHERFALARELAALFADATPDRRKVSNIASALGVKPAILVRALSEHTGDAHSDGPMKAAYLVVADLVGRDVSTVMRWRARGLETMFEVLAASDANRKPTDLGLLGLLPGGALGARPPSTLSLARIMSGDAPKERGGP